MRSKVQRINIEVLFWNINRKNKEDHSRPPIEEAIADWAYPIHPSDPKIIGVAECSDHWAQRILSRLQDLNPAWRAYQNYRNYLTCFYTANHTDVLIEPEVRINDEVAKHILPVKLTANNQRYLLIFIHLLSKITVNQDYENQAIIAYLLDYERRFFYGESIQNYRTIIAGDLNYNPFDPFLNHIPGNNPYFNRSRQFYLKTSALPNLFASWEQEAGDQDYFYNPSWKLLYDKQVGERIINFTYMFNNLHDRGQTDRSEQYFNLYDQVLLRPKMYAHFHDSDLQIVPYWFAMNEEPIYERVIKNILNRDLLPYSDHFAIDFCIRFVKRRETQELMMPPSPTTTPQLPSTGFGQLEVKEDVIYQTIDLFAQALQKDTNNQVLAKILEYTYERDDKKIEKTYIFEIVPANYRLLAVELFRISFDPNSEAIKNCRLAITHYPPANLRDVLSSVVEHHTLSAETEDDLNKLLTEMLVDQSNSNKFWRNKAAEAIASVQHSSAKK